MVEKYQGWASVVNNDNVPPIYHVSMLLQIIRPGGENFMYRYYYIQSLSNSAAYGTSVK